MKKNNENNRLRELRNEKKLKQSELAEIVGCSQQAISSYENCEYNSMKASTEEALADYFSCSIDYLRGLSSIRNPEKYFEEAILLKTEFQKLGIIGKDEDLSDELLNYFRDLIKANKPFLEKLSELKRNNTSEDNNADNE